MVEAYNSELKALNIPKHNIITRGGNTVGKNFIGELKEIIDDPKFGYADDQMMIKTGLPILDYLNGNRGRHNLNLGIDAGKVVTIIGKPGSGKSTMALQIAGNILKRYEQSSLFILDFEQSHGEARIKAVTGLTDEEYDEKVTVKQTGIATETVLEMVKQIKTLKLKYKKELTIENKEGFIDHKTGQLKTMLPPTIMIVDSAAMMMPRDDMFSDEMSGQMSA
jgi:RecA/RadA recombinase